MDTLVNLEHKAKMHFEKTLCFLHEYSWIYNFNWTKIFADNAMKNIPQEWKSHLLNLDIKELNSVPFGYSKNDWPKSLRFLIDQSIKLSPKYEVSAMCPKTSANVVIPYSIQCGMTPKKLHEVQHMAACVADVCSATKCSVIVDIGSGLGYLDQVLHHNYGYKIIGFESKERLCHEANIKMQKKGCCRNSIHYFTKTVTASREFAEELKQILSNLSKDAACNCENENNDRTSSEDETGCVLVGLHCCGDLGPAVCQLFCNVEEIKALVLVGCCYHKMSFNESTCQYFPLSTKLQNIYNENPLKEDTLKFGLRLASQETRMRWAKQSKNDHEEHSKHVAYRGIVDLSLTDSQIQWTKPRRHIARKNDFLSFSSYCSAFLDGFHCSDEEKQSHMIHLQSIFQQCQSEIPYIESMMLLQVLLQSVWESLLVLDRCWYLHERAIKVDVQAVFNEYTSPRNIALIGKKVSCL